jgi:hypothetical protein
MRRMLCGDQCSGCRMTSPTEKDVEEAALWMLLHNWRS